MMPLTQSLWDYIMAYETLSGCKPTAIPVTHSELLKLRDEWEPHLTVTMTVPEDERQFGICSMAGIDLFETQEATELRDSVTKRIMPYGSKS